MDQVWEFYNKYLANKEVSATVVAVKKKKEAEVEAVILDAFIGNCSNKGSSIEKSVISSDDQKPLRDHLLLHLARQLQLSSYNKLQYGLTR